MLREQGPDVRTTVACQQAATLVNGSSAWTALTTAAQHGPQAGAQHGSGPRAPGNGPGPTAPATPDPGAGEKQPSRPDHPGPG